MQESEIARDTYNTTGLAYLFSFLGMQICQKYYLKQDALLLFQNTFK